MAGTGKPGAATKLLPETVTRLEEALAMGSTYKLAAMYAGIAESTLHEWRATKPEFSERLTRVEGRAAVSLLALIQKAAQEDWRAAAWKLERRYPQDYGKQVTELQGRDGGAIQVEDTRILEVRAVDYRLAVQPLLTTDAEFVSKGDDAAS